jgi:TetR/AcrR family transcriptional regulator, transcriptional repressor for nem operon
MSAKEHMDVVSMRYESGHKAATRKRIVTAASMHIRKHGVKGTPVADVMREAGLTHGGFYALFKSKEALLRAALAEALDLAYEGFCRAAAVGGFEAMVRAYLANWHIARPEHGCAFAALMPEIARSSLQTRTMVAAKLDGFVDLFATYLPDGSLRVRRRRAKAIFGMMMGTVQIARAAPSRQQANQTLADGIEAAITFAKAS